MQRLLSISGSRRNTTNGGGGERLKIVTYNVRTLLKDEHVQELEEELKENGDVIELGEVRRIEEKFHHVGPTLQTYTTPLIRS